MAEFKRGEAKFIQACVESFSAHFDRTVAAVLARELRGVEPAPVHELREQLQLLLRQLEVRSSTVRVHEAMDGLLRRIVVSERRVVAEALEGPLGKAVDPNVVSTLQREIRRFDELMSHSWFQEARPQRVPRLTDFLSIRFAAEALPDAPSLAPRSYDEKFHVLEAPGLFLQDLAYYRHECGLREENVAVCYVDIDDFKRLNEKHTETKVDLQVLGPFLEAMEAWAFGHAHAYRFGGDEYVLLLPNVSHEICVVMLKDLRQRLARARYRIQGVSLSVSQGVVLVDPDCHLTDREVLARANQGKAHAKATQKGSIVVALPPSWDLSGAEVIR